MLLGAPYTFFSSSGDAASLTPPQPDQNGLGILKAESRDNTRTKFKTRRAHLRSKGTDSRQ